MGLWTLTMLGLAVLVGLDQLLRQTDRPALVARSSQRACQPPQFSETRELGASWWKTAWVAR